MMTYKVTDKTEGKTDGYIKVVFFRNDEIKSKISAFRWFILTIVEMVVGTEILESFTTTGSVKPCKTIVKADSDNYGDELHLTLHIPAGLITNILRNQIIELLYYKFHYQYMILESVGEPVIDKTKGTIDCSRTRFRARKELFYQFIALRRVYDFTWLIVNLSIDTVVFFATTDIKFALVSAIVVEAIRRFLKV